MKQKKNGKDRSNDFSKYGPFAFKELHASSHKYREFLARSAERTGNTYFLDKFDECWEKWSRDHGN